MTPAAISHLLDLRERVGLRLERAESRAVGAESERSSEPEDAA